MRSSPTRCHSRSQDGWRTGVAKELERQNAALVATEPIAA